MRYPILDVLKRKKGDTKLQSGSRQRVVESPREEACKVLASGFHELSSVYKDNLVTY